MCMSYWLHTLIPQASIHMHAYDAIDMHVILTPVFDTVSLSRLDEVNKAY
jgi:hypothetical protein